MSKTKQISKNKKANSKKQTNDKIVSTNEMINLLKIVVIVCAVLIVFYLITVFVNSKDETAQNSSNTTATIQYDKILVGQILNRNEHDYYVLVENENDQYIDLYNYYLSNYDGDNEDLKYYTVDLSEVFNGNHIGEKTTIGNEVSEFVFSDTTLLRVQNKIVTEVYDNREAIVSYLENLK